ncbi:MAG: histidine--tRNA ligase [Candidatus Thalassarchaeum sp.]|nr:histidine--tRNA ligase [Candidatus Thalassarchaeum sp.]MEC9351254.1 histidine--tRNA ligase [Candidatus Thermoplasmatota archaeon]MEC9393518.1 histidine--tRNA ligase [Candidatus Thermoplasmatota archaeon]MEC9478566.1 histidine--tRNA ligase [Candidatus Thermoplasmatota archaeon]MEE3303902.1 histidine--tRNA ligase [Candidatus Thermoplasmatota archaeon]
MTQGVRGTRDFYPEDMRLRNWLFERFHAAARSHGFEEYDAPVLESEELYTRKAGEDIVGQLYNFEDKGGRKVALRPEMTPSLARMVMTRAGALALPIKWYSIPQCWRYERTQRGRGREHYQWNVDIWGMEGVEADAELLSVLVHFFNSVGLGSDDLVIRISSRKVLEEVLGSLGIEGETFAQTCVTVDKMNKLPAHVIEAQLGDLGLSSDAISTIRSVLAITDLASLESALASNSEAVVELQSLFALCDSYGISDWVSFDASVVRGLAYYTGPVFEAHDRAGILRAICGGGRYDKLIGSLGGKDLPATGFGFGDMVIMELLADKGLIPELSSGVGDVVFGMGAELRGAAMQVAGKLRASGRSTDLVLEDKRIKWVFKHAERSGAARLVMVMPEEWSKGNVKVKDLATGEETEISFDSLG